MVNLFPKTVESDEEMEIDESDDEQVQDEAVTVRKKKKMANAAEEFAQDFIFESGDTQFIDRETEDLQKYLKKQTPTSLDEKIAEMRKLKNTGKAVIVEDEAEAAEAEEKDEEEDDVQQLGGKETRDTVREKRKSGKSKKSQENEDFFSALIDGKSLDTSVNVSFEQMNLSRQILKACSGAGYSDPTPIQQACIPVALTGKDICACAATGTGKTAAFVLPILERMIYRPKGASCTRVLVLVPTRELAIQVFQVFRKLSTFIQLEVCLCAGGLDLKAQEAALRSGPDVVVATPGRLIDHLHNSPSFNLSNIEVLVLDEADRMLEEAFRDQMNELIRLCAQNRQTLLFSATMTEEIDELASMSLQKPVKIFINENTDTALKLRQEFIRIRAGRETDREAMVAALVTRTFQTNTIVFVRTKKDCQRMQILLGLLGIKVGQMQSSLTQGQRIESLSKFKKAEIDVLVSTDLASRGLDIEGVQTVINMNMPKSIKQYIHRVGRTARAGKAGRSISLVGEDERKLLKEIVNSNADRTLKQRLVAPEVVEAYRRRIDELEETIQQIDEEDRAEKELRIAEASMAKTQNALEVGENGGAPAERRVWMMKESQIEKQRKREEKRQMKVDARKKAEAAKTPEDIQIEHEAAFHVRAAKRARHSKNKRIRAVVESAGTKGAGKAAQNKKKASSNSKTSLRDIPLVNAGSRGVQKAQKGQKPGAKKGFTSALASVSKKSVKAARHGPEDSKFQKARVAHRMKTKKY